MIVVDVMKKNEKTLCDNCHHIYGSVALSKLYLAMPNVHYETVYIKKGQRNF